MEVITHREIHKLTISYIKVDILCYNIVSFKLEMIYEIPKKRTCLSLVVLD